MFLKRELHSFALRGEFKTSFIDHFAFSYSITLRYTSEFSSYYFLPSSGLLLLTTAYFCIPLGIQ